MALSLSRENILRLQEIHPTVRAQSVATGECSQYTLDAVVRAYRDSPLSDLLRDAGLPADTPALEIRAGIGTLTLYPDKNTLTPTIKGMKPTPIPATAEIISARSAKCAEECGKTTGEKCPTAGCGCSGAGDPTREYGRCPRGLWAVALLAVLLSGCAPDRQPAPPPRDLGPINPGAIAPWQILPQDAVSAISPGLDRPSGLTCLGVDGIRVAIVGEDTPAARLLVREALHEFCHVADALGGHQAALRACDPGDGSWIRHADPRR